MLGSIDTIPQLATFLAFALFAGRACAVCAPGGVAIGRESVRFTDIIGTQVVYEGIAMINDCAVIGKTDFSQDAFQVCDGAWDGALSVSCTNGVPTSVLEAQGATLACSPTNDTSCNVNTGGTDPVVYEVVACCF